jgi:dTDP-L-rhamnose 4-epimerase
MKKSVLITGGAGFIGSHLTDELIEHGYKVRILDNLSEQIHGINCLRPVYLHQSAELVIGDLCDRISVENALMGIDVVFHLAAIVGVGQSMYEIQRYTQNNNLGTSILMECIAKYPIKKLIVASSMSIYGEGSLRNSNGEIVEVSERTLEQLKHSQWELVDNQGCILLPTNTNESKTPVLSSIYALSKYDQERMCLITGRAYGIPTFALRFFNVYGTRQSLSNPYTGVLAIFASQLINNNRPQIFEDGLQQRDFINVHDVTLACRLVLEKENISSKVFNIGSGSSYTINEVAGILSDLMQKSQLKPHVTNKYRVGDIRHCYADISLANSELGFFPQVKLQDGLRHLTEWLKSQIANDKISHAYNQLAERGLII